MTHSEKRPPPILAKKPPSSRIKAKPTTLKMLIKFVSKLGFRDPLWITSYDDITTGSLRFH